MVLNAMFSARVSQCRVCDINQFYANRPTWAAGYDFDQINLAQLEPWHISKERIAIMHE